MNESNQLNLRSKEKRICFVLALFICSTILIYGGIKVPDSEILWDNWGIPHIFAENNNKMIYGFGWAQMKNHGNRILKLYGEARGRAAEYWGKSFVKQDIIIKTMNIPGRSHEWKRAYSSEFMTYLNAFVQGMNDYSVKNDHRIKEQYKIVLPIKVEDIFSHTQRVLYLTMMAGNSQGKSKQQFTTFNLT